MRPLGISNIKNIESFEKNIQPDYVEYVFEQDNISNMEALFQKGKQHLVIIPSNKEAKVNRIITTLSGIKEKDDVDITLVGLPDWLRYQTIDPVDVHQLNSLFYSTYAMDYSTYASTQFVEQYRDWFNTEPMPISPYFKRAGSNSNFSRYSIWGFDVTYFFVNCAKEFGPQFSYCIDRNKKAKLLQSNFEFKRITNWGGWYNSGLKTIRFTPDYNIIINDL